MAVSSSGANMWVLATPQKAGKKKGKQVLMSSRAQVLGEDKCSLGMKPTVQETLDSG